MDGCVEWDGPLTDKGYGKTFVAGVGWRGAHRMVWEMFYGPIRDGLFVLHRCDNPPCVNIDHLFLGTNEDNMADMAAKRRSARGQWTHCPKGHPLPDRKPGQRQRNCPVCRVDANRQYRARKRVLATT